MKTITTISQIHQSYIIHLIERDDGKEQEKSLT